MSSPLNISIKTPKIIIPSQSGEIHFSIIDEKIFHKSPGSDFSIKPFKLKEFKWKNLIQSIMENDIKNIKNFMRSHNKLIAFPPEKRKAQEDESMERDRKKYHPEEEEEEEYSEYEEEEEEEEEDVQEIVSMEEEEEIDYEEMKKEIETEKEILERLEREMQERKEKKRRMEMENLKKRREEEKEYTGLEGKQEKEEEIELNEPFLQKLLQLTKKEKKENRNLIEETLSLDEWRQILIAMDVKSLEELYEVYLIRRAEIKILIIHTLIQKQRIMWKNRKYYIKLFEKFNKKFNTTLHFKPIGYIFEDDDLIIIKSEDLLYQYSIPFLNKIDRIFTYPKFDEEILEIEFRQNVYKNLLNDTLDVIYIPDLFKEIFSFYRLLIDDLSTIEVIKCKDIVVPIQFVGSIKSLPSLKIMHTTFEGNLDLEYVPNIEEFSTSSTIDAYIEKSLIKQNKQIEIFSTKSKMHFIGNIPNSKLKIIKCSELEIDYDKGIIMPSSIKELTIENYDPFNSFSNLSYFPEFLEVFITPNTIYDMYLMKKLYNIGNPSDKIEKRNENNTKVFESFENFIYSEKNENLKYPLTLKTIKSVYVKFLKFLGKEKERKFIKEKNPNILEHKEDSNVSEILYKDFLEFLKNINNMFISFFYILENPEKYYIIFLNYLINETKYNFNGFSMSGRFRLKIYERFLSFVIKKRKENFDLPQALLSFRNFRNEFLDFLKNQKAEFFKKIKEDSKKYYLSFIEHLSNRKEGPFNFPLSLKSLTAASINQVIPNLVSLRLTKAQNPSPILEILDKFENLENLILDDFINSHNVKLNFPPKLKKFIYKAVGGIPMLLNELPESLEVLEHKLSDPLQKYPNGLVELYVEISYPYKDFTIFELDLEKYKKMKVLQLSNYYYDEIIHEKILLNTEWKLKDDKFPPNLEVFDTKYSNFMQDIKKLPSSIRILKLGIKYSGKIHEGAFPSNLSSNLKELSIDRYDKGNTLPRLPDSILHLELGKDFNVEIKELPRFLRFLKIDSDYLYSHFLPPFPFSLLELVFINSGHLIPKSKSVYILKIPSYTIVRNLPNHFIKIHSEDDPIIKQKGNNDYVLY